MLNKRREHVSRVEVTAAAARSSGAVIIEQQFPGVTETSPATGDKYALDIGQLGGEYEVPFITGAVKGDTVLMDTTTFALTRQSAFQAISAGLVAFAKVTAVPGDGPDSSDLNTPTQEPLAGKMWIALLPPAA